MKNRFTWTDEAKADLRRIRKEQALIILKALARFAREGAGDVKKLTGTRGNATAFVSAITGCSFVPSRTAPSTFSVLTVIYQTASRWPTGIPDGLL